MNKQDSLSFEFEYNSKKARWEIKQGRVLIASARSAIMAKLITELLNNEQGLGK